MNTSFVLLSGTKYDCVLFHKYNACTAREFYNFVKQNILWYTRVNLYQQY